MIVKEFTGDRKKLTQALSDEPSLYEQIDTPDTEHAKGISIRVPKATFILRDGTLEISPIRDINQDYIDKVDLILGNL